MAAPQNIIGIVYDYDQTLSPTYMQDEVLFPAFGIDPPSFWKRCGELVDAEGYDNELAYLTVLGDNPINRNSRKLDSLCHAFIARHLPSAGHLRLMSSIVRVNVALERIGLLDRVTPDRERWQRLDAVVAIPWT